MKVLSIICITYNHEKYIRKTIKGFLNQRVEFPIQILVGDDCSTDGTTKILKEIYNEYPDRIELYTRDKNLGSTANLLDLFKRAKGKYIAYCEGDDYWSNPNKLQLQVDFLENNSEYGMVWTDIDIINIDLKIIPSIYSRNILKKYNEYYEVLINRPFLAVPTWVFRAKYLKNYINEFSFNNYNDGTFFLLLEILRNDKIHFIDIVTAVYRVLPTSQSNLGGIKGRLSFIKGVHKMQMDIAKKYELGMDIVIKIKESYYRDAIFSAYICNDQNTIKEAVNFTKINKVNLKTKIMTYICIVFPDNNLLKNILLKIRGSK